MKDNNIHCKDVNSHVDVDIRTNPPLILKVAEAAKFIGISERGLRELIATRKIRVVRIGRRVMLRLKDIEAWIEEQVS